MDSYLADRRAIDDLMTGWIRRDLAQWDAMRELFHPDGIIEITWFTGLFTDFVDASARMGASDLRTKHVITSPVVAFNPDAPIRWPNRCEFRCAAWGGDWVWLSVRPLVSGCSTEASVSWAGGCRGR
ncbi:nuclear transport factor 2 family protein [Rhodococcus opacus]|uniref:nuclear transport factor 2 family protein n=1 Tax=Rhodococcus opacus TaxID=37919 RepID=UPI001CEC7642|nr:nuclear transport factor 2 family protein [Rhodococcus opacus]